MQARGSSRGSERTGEGLGLGPRVEHYLIKISALRTALGGLFFLAASARQLSDLQHLEAKRRRLDC